jgi:chromate reductase
MAQQHLRNMLAYLDMPTLGQPEIFMQVREGMFADGAIANADTRGFLQPWVDAYSAWVKRFASGVAADSR